MRTLAYLIALAVLMPDSAGAASAAPAKSCLILGDDIAKAVAKYKPECDVIAVDGRNSARVADNTPRTYYPYVIVSAGTNDPLNPKLGPNLFVIRRALKAGRVTWIAPYNVRAQQRVYETAAVHHDNVVYLRSFKQDFSKEGQPKDYKKLARKL